MSGAAVVVPVPGRPTLPDAGRVMRMATDAVSDAGYILALYGSTITRYRGNDIDVLLVPKRVGARAMDGIEAMIRALRCSPPLEPPYYGLMNTVSVSMLWEGMVLDVQVREVPR